MSDSSTFTISANNDWDGSILSSDIDISGITLGSSDTMVSSDYNYSTITVGGTGYGSGGVYTTTTSPNLGSFSIDSLTNWNEDSVKITKEGIELPEGSDINIDGKSLRTFMDTMEKRLAILQPNPKKLEKFEALQKAYNHYKTLEALCDLDDEDEE